MAAMPPGMAWPPPEWGVGGPAPVDPLTALPPAGASWPPPAWTGNDERPTPILPPPSDTGEPWDAADIEIEAPVDDGIDMSGLADQDAPEARAAREAELAGRIRGAERAPFATPPGGAGVVWPPPEWGVGGEASKPTLASPDDEATAADLERMAGSEKTTADVEDDQAAAAAAAHQAEIDRLADLDPETFLRIQGERTLRAEAARATEERMLAEQQRQALEDNIAIREKARAAAQRELDEVTASAKGLSEAPFADFWESRTTMQKAAGYLSAIISGFLSGRNGGRNTAIDLFMKVAEDNYNAKLTKLRERRTNAREQLGAADDNFRMQEAIRQATYEQGVRFLESKLANLDPQGEAAMRIAGGIRDLRERQAQAAAAAGEHLFKRNVETFKADTDRMRAEAEMLRAQAEAAKKLGLGGGAGGAGKVKHPPEYFVTQYGIDPKDAPPVPMTDKEFDKYRQVRRDTQMHGNAAAAEERAKADADRTAKAAVDAKTINDPFTGKPLGTITGATDPRTLQEALDAGTTVVKTIDKLRRLAAKAEGASDYVKSAEWQEIKATQSFLTGVLGKALQLGALDKGLIEVTDKMMGSTDPTSFIYNADAGLAMAKSNFEGRARDMLRGAGIDESKWNVPDMGKLPRPKKDALGARLSAEQTFDQRSARMRRGQRGQLDQATLRVDITGDKPTVAFDNEDDSAEYDKDALDMAAVAIERGDDDAAVQAANIIKAAGASQNPAMRKNAALRLRAMLKAKDPTLAKVWADTDDSRRAAALAGLPEKERKQAFGELFPELAPEPAATGKKD